MNFEWSRLGYELQGTSTSPHALLPELERNKDNGRGVVQCACSRTPSIATDAADLDCEFV